MAEQHNAFGDRIYFWVDGEGIRCSPRHRTLKAAIHYAKDSEHYWVTDENGRPRQIDRDRENLPSQKRPQALRVGEYVERALSEDEQSKMEQIQVLIAEGFV